MEQRCVIVGRDPNYSHLVLVRVPGIYPKGSALPARLARLYEPAVKPLDDAMIEIAAAGGHVFYSDMFRSTADQAKAHQDYLTGRKSAYSPPPGGSMHEAGRALDLDIGDTGIGLAAVKKILAKHGWTGIADRGSESWHHDFQGPDGAAAYNDPNHEGMSKYRHMARHCISALEPDLPPVASRPSVVAADNAVMEIQRLLGLKVDGIYGPFTRQAVRAFQMNHGLEPDGICGPITLAKMRGEK